MSETDLAPLWKAMGVMEGRADAHDKRLDQQHQDTLRLTDEVKSQNAMMLRCFADAEERNQRALDKSIETMRAIFAAELSAAVSNNNSFDLKALFQKPAFTIPAGGGVGAALMMFVQWLQSIPLGAHP